MNSKTMFGVVLGNDKLIKHHGDRSAISSQRAQRIASNQNFHYYLLSTIRKGYKKGCQ